MPALANRYEVCHLYNIDPEQGAEGPFIIAQEAYDPEDELMIDTVFLLRRDGTWFDEMAQALVPEERRFLIFYDSREEAAEALEGLIGVPVIERHSLTTDDLRARIVSWQGGGYISMRVELAERYREWKRTEARPG